MGVPLLMRGPGIREGHHQVAHPISLMDLYPTTCALAGLPIPEGLDGVDFSSVLAHPDTTPSPREYAPSAYYAYGVRINYSRTPDDTPHAAWRAIRDERWKYVEIEKGQPLLFDLVEDPDETTNLAGQPAFAALCSEMKEKLFTGFSWEQVHAQLAADRERLPDFFSGVKPTTPNQYMFEDGRIFDAEAELYGARWLRIPEGAGSIIPQMFG